MQLLAFERLRPDFSHAQPGPRVTIRWDQLLASARGQVRPLYLSGGQIAAKRRFEAAVAASGPGFSDVVWRVNCGGERLETAERASGWSLRAVQLVLQLALARLVSHYRLDTKE